MPQPQRQLKQDVYWVHLIRGLAVIFVVLLHASAQVLQLDVEFASGQWWAGNIIDSALRMCVPLLFMITGFLLVAKTEPLGVFFNKRLSKVAVPLVCWSAVYITWLLLVESKNPTPISPFSKEIADAVVNGFPFSLLGLLFAPAYYHLWFMYALIGVYLCLPIMRALVQGAERKVLWYFIAVWSVVTFGFPLLKMAGMYNLVEMNMVSGNMGYVLLGYLLGTAKISRRLYLCMWPAYIISVAITAYGTFAISSSEALNQTFYGNVPSVLLMTVSSFIVLRYLGETSRLLQASKVKLVVLNLSACTFGIYLIHALFLYIFHKGMLGFTLDAIQGPALLFIPLTAAAVYLVSWASVSVMARVPYLRGAVGIAAPKERR